MALLKVLLRQQLINVLKQSMSDPDQIGRGVGQAYQSYARTAQGAAGPATLIGVEYLKLSTPLGAQLRARAPAASIAQTIGAGLTLFWLAPPVLFGVGAASAIITPPGVAMLQSINYSSAEQAASAMADAMDVITRTVIVTYPSGTPPPAPVF